MVHKASPAHSVVCMKCSVDELPLLSDGPTQLANDSMTRRFYSRSEVTGEITLPAVPSMIDEYVKMCSVIFETVGRQFTAEELTHLRAVLEEQLAEAYSISPRSTITISYNAPQGPTLNYHIQAKWWTLTGAYERWISTREPPLFGTEPDARVWALANEARRPPNTPDTRNRGRNGAQRPCSGTTWAPGRRLVQQSPEVRRHDQLR